MEKSIPYQLTWKPPGDTSGADWTGPYQSVEVEHRIETESTWYQIKRAADALDRVAMALEGQAPTGTRKGGVLHYSHEFDVHAGPGENELTVYPGVVVFDCGQQWEQEDDRVILVPSDKLWYTVALELVKPNSDGARMVLHRLLPTRNIPPDPDLIPLAEVSNGDNYMHIHDVRQFATC